MTQAEAQLLAADYLHYKNQVNFTDNSILYALARQSGSAEVYHALWQRPVDATTYRALAELPASMNEAQSIEQISRVSEKTELASQAMLLMAKQYSHNKRAQEFLEKAISSEALAWHAASAYKFIKDPAFKNKIAKKLEQQPDKVSQFAAKNLKHGELK